MRFTVPSLPIGVRILLSILAAFYVVDLIGRVSETFSIYSLLALTPVQILQLQLWRLLSYALLPAGFLDLLFTGIVIAWIGTRIERTWSRHDFLIYCGICVIGGGGVRTFIEPGGTEAVFGSAALAVGLLVAWARLFGHERVRPVASWDVRLFNVATVIGLLILLSAFLIGGWRHACLLAGSGLTGWIFLSLRWKQIHSQPAARVESGRINRLEL